MVTIIPDRKCVKILCSGNFRWKNRKSLHDQAKMEIGPFFTRFYLGKMDFGQK